MVNIEKHQTQGNAQSLGQAVQPYPFFPCMGQAAQNRAHGIGQDAQGQGHIAVGGIGGLA